MSSVLQCCRDLGGQLTEHTGRKRAAKDSEAFRERASELRGVREALATAVAKASVLRLRRIAPSVELRDPGSAVSALQVVRQRLDSEPASINTGREYGQLKRSLDRLAKEASAGVEKTLEAVKRNLPAIDETFLRLVEAIPDYRAKVAEIRTKREEFLQHVDLAALDANALANFLDQREALRQLADSLQPAEFPPAVLEFFRVARQASGAPLETLTEEVREWLRQRKLLRLVRVSVVDR
jgi:hypothetical protein